MPHAAINPPRLQPEEDPMAPYQSAIRKYERLMVKTFERVDRLQEAGGFDCPEAQRLLQNLEDKLRAHVEQELRR